MSDSRRSSLAKLMATENISVEHKNIPTAYFNTKDRVLGLPIWKNASKDVYDLLVGHEVSHALYTPVNWVDGIESIDPSNFNAVKSYINVVEDARIEKLIKRIQLTVYPKNLQINALLPKLIPQFADNSISRNYHRYNILTLHHGYPPLSQIQLL